MSRKKEVERLAKKLEAWAETKALTDKERVLLRLLLARCQKVKPQIVIKEPTYAYKTDIRQAVIDALQHIDDVGNPVGQVPDRPEEGWARGPTWARAGIWPRA
jgi:hypothetical protein